MLEERKGVLAIPEGAIIYKKDHSTEVEIPDATTETGKRRVRGDHRHQQRVEDADRAGPHRRAAGRFCSSDSEAVLCLKELFGQVLSSLLRNKLRSFLTMAGIAWGVASIVLIVAMGDGFKDGPARPLPGAWARTS